MSKYLPVIRYETNRELFGAKISAVYFLIKEGAIVYIGRTSDIKTRISAHKSLLKHRHEWFDSFRFINCSNERLEYYESRWINKFKPIHNLPMGTKKRVSISNKMTAFYIKLPGKLKTHATKYAKERGGLSKLVRDLLVKETKYKET